LPREPREADGDGDDPAVHFNRGRRERGQSIGRRGEHRLHAPVREQHAERAASDRDQHTFEQDRADEPGATRTQGGADSHFAQTERSGGQKQIRNVRARDEQHERNGAEQHEQRGARRGIHPGHILLAQAEVPAAGDRRCLVQAVGELVGGALRVGHDHAAREPAHAIEAG
jgi:hypothetical protein